ARVQAVPGGQHVSPAHTPSGQQLPGTHPDTLPASQNTSPAAQPHRPLTHGSPGEQHAPPQATLGAMHPDGGFFFFFFFFFASTAVVRPNAATPAAIALPNPRLARRAFSPRAQRSKVSASITPSGQTPDPILLRHCRRQDWRRHPGFPPRLASIR